MSETILIRLKPYDPRRGNVLRRFAYRGIKIYEDRGWYRVPVEIADYLRSVRQVAAVPHSPLAFDVHTEAEANDIEAKEVADKASRAGPIDAAVVTSDESPRGGRGGSGGRR